MENGFFAKTFASGKGGFPLTFFQPSGASSAKFFRAVRFPGFAGAGVSLSLFHQRQCERVGTWLCGYVTMWLCGYVFMSCCVRE